MPKVKTHKSSQKRIVRVASNGLIIARHMSVAHRARFKSKRAKQKSTQTFTVSRGMAMKLRELAV